MNLSKDLIDPNAVGIIKRLNENGHKAYIVGGAVRDLVMRYRPKDTDIVTDASPEEVEALFERTVPVGARFGVTLVVVDGTPYEVARFRADGPYDDGRHPTKVTPASIYDDAVRRDFTINGLIYDVITDKVIDYVSGLRDIESGIIRTVGNPEVRFGEDRLRMIRAIRFAARFGFKIESATMAAIRQLADSIIQVSAERIGQEIGTIISGPHPEYGFDLLNESGLLAVILPEAAALKGVDQPQAFHPEGDIFAHTREMLRLFGGGSLTLGFGILLHDIGKPSTRTESDRIRFNRHDVVGAEITVRILKRLRMSSETVERVRYLVANHMKFTNVPLMRESALKRFMAMDGFSELLELYRLDCLASHGDLSIFEMLTGLMSSESTVEQARIQLPDPLLSGDDLIALGFEPGPQFGTMLDWLYDEQLEGRIKTKEEAITAIQESFPPADD